MFRCNSLVGCCGVCLIEHAEFLEVVRLMSNYPISVIMVIFVIITSYPRALSIPLQEGFTMKPSQALGCRILLMILLLSGSVQCRPMQGKSTSPQSKCHMQALPDPLSPVKNSISASCAKRDRFIQNQNT